jgi:3-hydroxyisobutyrate dehydrogenase-like beta-hydroxyacid dehydrogenase
MTATITVIAQGAMGSATAEMLHRGGATVLTWLEGRSPASHARARACFMQAATLDQIAASDLILSIVPPGDAMALARLLAPALTASPKKPLYADCNAVSPATSAEIGAIITATGADFVDGGIIGGPPKPGATGTSFPLSGPHAAQAAALLTAHGIDARVMNAPNGAASALKMSYAGITKGMTALAAFMALGATRAGAGPALVAELGETQPALRTRFGRALPDMAPKAYRWVAEMREIAAFLKDDPDGAMVYEGIARLYERLAATGPEIDSLIEFADQLRRESK